MVTYQTLEYTNTKWEDSQVAATSVKLGVTAPTWEGGFKGDGDMYCLNFVHNQADEVLFTVQLPHARKLTSLVYPHVHFTPYAALGAGTYAGQFILKYYYGLIGGSFSALQTITMTKNWTGEQQWVHFIADTTPYSLAAGISTVLQCRLYRDNTVGNNFAGKLSFLGFDFHLEIDTPAGSGQETAK